MKQFEEEKQNILNYIEACKDIAVKHSKAFLHYPMELLRQELVPLTPKVKQLEWKALSWTSYQADILNVARYKIFREGNHFTLQYGPIDQFDCITKVFVRPYLTTVYEGKGIAQQHFEEFILGYIE